MRGLLNWNLNNCNERMLTGFGWFRRSSSALLQHVMKKRLEFLMPLTVKIKVCRVTTIVWEMGFKARNVVDRS
jgi:hypothetical protein